MPAGTRRRLTVRLDTRILRRSSATIRVGESGDANSTHAAEGRHRTRGRSLYRELQFFRALRTGQLFGADLRPCRVFRPNLSCG